MINEKRTAPRISFKTSASIYYGKSSVVKASLETRDISLAGVFLKTETQIPEGTACSLEIDLSGSSSQMHFVVEGEICRNEDEGIAVRFNELKPDGYAHIKNLMNIHKEKPQ